MLSLSGSHREPIAFLSDKAPADSVRQWAGDSRTAAERRLFVPALIASDLRRNLVRHPGTWPLDRIFAAWMF